MLEELLRDIDNQLRGLLSEEENTQIDFIANLRKLNIIDDAMEEKLLEYYAEKNRDKKIKHFKKDADN